MASKDKTKIQAIDNDELKKVHMEALERFRRVQSKEQDQRDLAISDMKFVNAVDGQWDDDAAAKRANRPRYTINRVAPAIDQLVGDQRQNRTQIKVRPVSTGADEDTAEIFGGLIRNIEAQSKAENAYDGAYDEQTTGGYGGWRLVTEFNDDDSFEQDIRIKPVPSAASSLFLDPSITEFDGRDGKWGFLISWMNHEEFEEKYPDASKINFPINQYYNPNCGAWFDNKMIQIAEYWVKTPVKRTILLLSDGRVIDKDDEEKVLDELKDAGITVVKERQAPSHKVVMYKMNGAEIFEGPKKWAGKYIPLILCRGKVSQIETETLVRGITRFAKDPQRIYNYATSAGIEAAALTPKDPVWLTAKQALGYEEKLQTFAQKNDPFMLYNHDPDAPGVPQRTGAPSVQTALIGQIQQAAVDIESSTGVHAAALGNAPQLLSERSVRSQAEKGDRGAYVFQDNLHKCIQYTGDQLVDLIPKVYDTPRIVRILGVDDKSDEVEINMEAVNEFNQPIMDEETGEQVIVNDLAKGKYETVIDTGPAYATQRVETVDQLIELTAADPRVGAVALDLIVKNLDILNSDELHKRIRENMIKEGVVQPTEEEIKELGLDQPKPEDPNAVALRDNVEMQTTDLMSQIEKRDADRDKVEVETAESSIDAYAKLIDSIIAKKENGIAITEAENALLRNQAGVVELSQDQAVRG